MGMAASMEGWMVSLAAGGGRGEVNGIGAESCGEGLKAEGRCSGYAQPISSEPS